MFKQSAFVRWSWWGWTARVMIFFWREVFASSGVSSPSLTKSFTSEWSRVTCRIRFSDGRIW